MKNYKSGYGFYMALCAAPTKEKRLELIKNCENINVQGGMDETALIYATHIGNEEIARLLIENGANLNLQDKEGKTALMHAIQHDYLKEIAKLLVEKGANLNLQDKEGLTVVMYAIWCGEFELAKLFIEKGARLDLLDKDGKSALRWAVDSFCDEGGSVYPKFFKRADLGFINLLIDKGKNLDSQDKDGTTVLMVVSEFPAPNTLAAVKLLVKKGARLDLRDKKGMTALMRAKRNNRKEIINFLELKEKANVEIKEKANVENTVNKPWYSTLKQKILYLYNKVKGINR